MTVFNTKNGAYATYGSLEKAGLAVAFNIENFLFKTKKLNDESWQADAAKLISVTHTVLAQQDQNKAYPARMLNAGGILTFITNDAEKPTPLGMMLLSEKGGLQLGFGKVELRDLDQRFEGLQKTLDEQLKAMLMKILAVAKNKDDFMARIKGVELSDLEKTIAETDKATGEILSDLSGQELQEQRSSFDRPVLNGYSVKAIKTAATREISEEVEFQMNGAALNPNRFVIGEALNREVATQYVQSVLVTGDKTKFSAKEFNNDFESTTFVVTCAVDQSEFNSIKHSQTCALVQPKEVQIKIVNADKGMLQTSIVGYPPILGGGNQFTVALFCNDVLKMPAVFVSPEADKPKEFEKPMVFFAAGESPAPAVTQAALSANKPGQSGAK